MEYRGGTLENLGINHSFWQGRNVFITGHTGFKGSWLSLWLSHLGANITGFSLDVPTEPSFFEIAGIRNLIQKNIFEDIRNFEKLIKALNSSKPEIVIHMAAQSLVRDSYSDPLKTYSTNVMGTVNILEAIRATINVKAVLNITSDKCYENKEWVWGYRENDSMGGNDPYSSSKGCAELISSAYRKSFLEKSGIAIASARAGNVIGGGDWSKDRIVPDAISSFKSNKTLMIRFPKATRPWQYVLEPLSGYITLCQQLIKKPKDHMQGWNFGPNEESIKPVSYIADYLANRWGNDAQWQFCMGEHPHEARSLKLDCSKAKKHLNWAPIWSLERTLDETVKWYQAWHSHKDMYDFSLFQIKAFQKELEPK